MRSYTITLSWYAAGTVTLHRVWGAVPAVRLAGYPCFLGSFGGVFSDDAFCPVTS